MNWFKKRSSRDNYFLLFENRSTNTTRFLQVVLMVAIVANVLLIILVFLGVIRAPRVQVGPRATPAPTPVHYAE